MATKKMKKLESVNFRLQLVVKSGMYMLGYKETLKMIRQGKATLVTLASNCPVLRKSEIQH